MEDSFPFADETPGDREGKLLSWVQKKEAHSWDSSLDRLSPMQLGWVPLHVPSDWQNLRGEPTNTRGGWQEKETDDL